MIPAFLRPFLAAILMVPLLSLAGWIAAHGGPAFPDEQIHKIVDYVLELVFPVMAALAVVFRRFVDKKANPTNTASAHLAVDGKVAVKEMLAAEKSAKADTLVNTEVPFPTPDNSPELPPRQPMFRPPADEPQD